MKQYNICPHCGGRGCNICCCCGPQGPTGATGSQGLQGATGPQGLQGPTGATGPSNLLNLVDGNASGSVRGIHTATGYTMGVDAVALGFNTTASGDYSYAEGYNTSAVGDYSHAEGARTTASGTTSHAEGVISASSGAYSHAEGYNTIAGGTASHAEGWNSTASGNYSHAEGDSTASNYYAHAEGYNTTASAEHSHSQGLSSIAAGFASHAANRGTIAQNSYQTAIGKFNVASSPAYNNSQLDDAFIIGNGDVNTFARSNAFRVQFNGNVHSASGLYTTGADYAEMFEWKDGNPQNEDRRGYFVTAKDGYILKATDCDRYVLGVVSATPSMAGDSQSCGWQGMYLRDEFGAVLYEWVDEEREIPEINPQTGEKQVHVKKVRVQRPKLNPAYDVNQHYLPRSERSEWAAVGMMGKLIARDDGTCRPNGFCRPNADGVATASVQGYFVFKRLTKNKVLILLDGPLK